MKFTLNGLNLFMLYVTSITLIYVSLEYREWKKELKVCLESNIELLEEATK